MSNSTPHIAVTGAAGYIGSRVVDQLQKTHPEWRVTALDNFYRGQVRRVGDIDIEHVDIRHREELAAALDGADVVLHLAAVSGVDDCDTNPDLAHDVNVQGTNNVAWWCRASGAALAFPFSMAVLGDPTVFPITTDLPRAPLNWYGRSKVLGERAIETFAEGAFPAHLFMISNVYGEHTIDGTTVSKGTVINFFLNRALARDPITVYAPGTQARNYVHVTDVAQVYILSAERLVQQLSDGITGVERYEIGTDEDPSVMEVAELVKTIAHEERGIDVDLDVVENPRSAETLVDTFTVDTTDAADGLGWRPAQSVEDTIRTRLRETEG
ncbi:NAD-dependent epimerase/dehydratase family protein [Halocatena marina]|uniref:NAD-dependent epimerase/dehydratase family protein n=1 Tax=Halocatena marina TaxID=2934937 RepID=A0ABD5YRW2_9EURY|nr:NAD(P)-dependent oxidoreductase [Halocatena marina]